MVDCVDHLLVLFVVIFVPVWFVALVVETVVAIVISVIGLVVVVSLFSGKRAVIGVMIFGTAVETFTTKLSHSSLGMMVLPWHT